jgi:UDP-3-O-[3-hydroxymyristoyl] glucosamine N-acyltransferase
MSRTLAELALRVGGTVVGDGTVAIHAAKPLHDAGEGEITFVENAQSAGRLEASRASAAIVDDSFPKTNRSLIVVDDPLFAFIQIAQHFAGEQRSEPIGVHPQAWVSPKARLGKQCSVFPNASVDDGAEIGDRCEIHSGAAVGRDCRLGDDVVLYPNAVVYPNTHLGNRVIVHAGAVLGADGFGYRTRDGRHVKVPQLGSVRIEDDVEIGAGATVDRGTFGVTVIGEGTKIDNLVQVGHNCRIGRHNLLAGQVGFAGSCETGDYVVVAGQGGIRDHVRIGTGSMIGAQAGVMGDVPEGARFVGSPATPEWEQKRIVMALSRLPEMRKTLRQMEKDVARLSSASRQPMLQGQHAPRDARSAERPERSRRSVVHRERKEESADEPKDGQ